MTLRYAGHPGSPRHARLALEQLGDRIVPNAAPVITNFSIAALGSGYYTFAGHVSDEDPAALAVAFSGAPAEIDGLKAGVGADGWFSLTAHLSSGGRVAVSTEDWEGLESNTAVVFL